VLAVSATAATAATAAGATVRDDARVVHGSLCVLAVSATAATIRDDSSVLGADTAIFGPHSGVDNGSTSSESITLALIFIYCTICANIKECPKITNLYLGESRYCSIKATSDGFFKSTSENTPVTEANAWLLRFCGEWSASAAAVASAVTNANG